MKRIGGSAVLNAIILWSGAAAWEDPSPKLSLAARCWVFVHSYHTQEQFLT